MKVKTLGSNPGKYHLWGCYFILLRGVRPMPVKTAMEAENYSKKAL